MTENEWDRLARYLSGNATSAEQAEVERWSAGNAEREALIAQLRRRWQAAEHRGERDVDAAWARLNAKLATITHVVDDDAEEIFTLAQRRRPWGTAARLLPLAAAIVVVAGLTLVWRAGSSRPGSGPSTLGSPVVSAEMRTGVGQRRTVDLPDGSRIVVGAASTIRLGERFAAGERHVYLEGQALFSVRHDAARPFVVHASGTVTEDLGTEFDIRAYAGDSLVRVAVAEGAVAVRREQSGGDTVVTLHPGDVAHVSSSGSARVLSGQNVASLLAWTSGEIVFSNTPLAEVAKELERWFDIDCRIEDSSLERKPLTAQYRTNGSLEDVLRTIEMSLEGVRVERDGRVVTFKSGPRARAFQTPAPAQPRRMEAGA